MRTPTYMNVFLSVAIVTIGLCSPGLAQEGNDKSGKGKGGNIVLCEDGKVKERLEKLKEKIEETVENLENINNGMPRKIRVQMGDPFTKVIENLNKAKAQVQKILDKLGDGCVENLHFHFYPDTDEYKWLESFILEDAFQPKKTENDENPDEDKSPLGFKDTQQDNSVGTVHNPVIRSNGDELISSGVASPVQDQSGGAPRTQMDHNDWLAAFNGNGGNIFQAWAGQSPVSAGVLTFPDDNPLTRLQARGNKLNTMLAHARAQATVVHQNGGQASYVQGSTAQSTTHNVVQSNLPKPASQAPASEPVVNNSSAPTVAMGTSAGGGSQPVGPQAGHNGSSFPANLSAGGPSQPAEPQPWNVGTLGFRTIQGPTIQTGTISLPNQPTFTGQVMINKGNTLAAPVPLNVQPQLGGKIPTSNAPTLGVLR